MNNKKRKNNKSGFGGLIAIAVVFLVNMASVGAGSELFAVLIGLAVVIAVIVAVVVVAKKSIGAAKISSYLNREEKNEEKTFVPREAAPASYDENAQEKNFIRDRARRLAQLDGFLKNGIIDRKEYNILKSRYLKEKI